MFPALPSLAQPICRHFSFYPRQLSCPCCFWTFACCAPSSVVLSRSLFTCLACHCSAIASLHPNQCTCRVCNSLTLWEKEYAKGSSSTGSAMRGMGGGAFHFMHVMAMQTSFRGRYPWLTTRAGRAQMGRTQAVRLLAACAQQVYWVGTDRSVTNQRKGGGRRGCACGRQAWHSLLCLIQMQYKRRGGGDLK